MVKMARGNKPVTAIIPRPTAHKRAPRPWAVVFHDGLRAAKARQLHQLLDGKAAFARHQFHINLLGDRLAQVL